MREETVPVNGIEVNYKIVGEGPTILILHGWGSKSDRWIKVAELLSQNNFSVVVPDLPGFGKSVVPPLAWGTSDYCNFVDQFVQKIGMQDFCLLGHSFGGGVAAMYGAKFPSRVRKLILFASAVFRKKTARKTMFRFFAGIIGIFSFLPFYQSFRKAFYRFIVRKSDYPYVSEMMKETYKKVISNDLSSFLSSIQVPTLIVWGDRDDVIPVSDAYLIQEKIKNSQLAVVPGGDHDIEQCMPELLVGVVAQFLRS